MHLGRRQGEEIPPEALNDLTSRLAAIEERPAGEGGNDSRVDDILSRLEKVEKRRAAAAGDQIADIFERLGLVETAVYEEKEDPVMDALTTSIRSLEAEAEKPPPPPPRGSPCCRTGRHGGSG